MRIKVIGRLRPQLERERRLGEEIVTFISSPEPSSAVSSSAENNDSNNIRKIESLKTDISIQARNTMAPKLYRLDCVLDEKSTQAEVFDQTVPLLDDMIENGFNCSLFTYGQTGTGKTYTMLGYDLWSSVTQTNHSLYPSEENMGIIPRSMAYLFQQLVARKNECQVLVSYIEIYNEKIIDLLNPSSDDSPTSAKSLSIQENKQGQIVIPGLVEVEVRSTSQIFEVLWAGAKARSIAATDMNDYSSRSHTIFQVVLSQNVITSQNAKVRMQGKMSFVDLAGSEKWRSHQLSKFTSERIRELTSINKSLSTLGKCVAALIRPGGSSTGAAHIPYRDSKLTRLLQDSLGGNAKTLFIVTISPSISCMDETTSTLQFADRAMKVQIFASPNVYDESDSNPSNKKLIERYKQEIASLKSIIQTFANKNQKKTRPIAGVTGDHQEENSFALEETLANEVTELRADTYLLSQKLSNCLRELNSSASTINKLTKAIFGETFPDLANRASVENPGIVAGFSSSDESRGNPQEGEQELKSQSTMLVDKLTFDKSIDSQMKSLEVLYSELDARGHHIAEVQLMQEERWQSLLKFHSWLQSQAQIRRQKDAVALNSSAILDDEDDTVERVALLEASVLFQSEELQRAKAHFLKTNNQMSEELAAAQREVCRLQNLLAAKVSPEPVVLSPQTPICDFKTTVPNVLASHLSRLDGDEHATIAGHRSKDNLVLDLSSVHRTFSAVNQRLDYSPMKEEQKTRTEKLTPCKIPRPVRIKRHSTLIVEEKADSFSHQSIVNVQELQTNLAELVTLMSTAKYQNFKELFAQLNNLVTDNKSLLGSKPQDFSTAISASTEHLDSKFSKISEVNTEEDIVIKEDRDSYNAVDIQDADRSDGEDNNSSLQSNTLPPNASYAPSASSLTSSVDAVFQVAASSGDPVVVQMQAAAQNSCGHSEQEKDLGEDRASFSSIENLPQDQNSVTVHESQHQELAPKEQRRRSVRKSISSNGNRPSKPISKPTLKYLWKAYTDGASGDTYYHNKRDNVTTWEKPSHEELRLVLLADGSVVSDSNLM